MEAGHQGSAATVNYLDAVGLQGNEIGGPSNSLDATILDRNRFPRADCAGPLSEHGRWSESDLAGHRASWQRRDEGVLETLCPAYCITDRGVASIRRTTIFDRSIISGILGGDFIYPVFTLINRLIELFALLLAVEAAHPDIEVVFFLAHENCPESSYPSLPGRGLSPLP